MTYVEEQLILKRIDELEKHQKEQDEILKKVEEKINLASIGFPTNFL